MRNRAFDYSRYADWRDPNELTPYAQNAKIHDAKNIRNIANSIKRFGWRQELVITPDNVVVVGHGRRLAAMKIGCMVPVTVMDKTADELTDKDIREYRVADNQTNAETGNNKDILSLELDDLDFDGFDFDFDLPEEKPEEDPEDDDGYFGDERERTYDAMRLNEFDIARSEGKFDMPTVPRCEYVPESLTPFNYLLSTEKSVDTVHFFIDDYRFERVWREPLKYAEILLRKAKAVCMPDFSLYTDMPEAGKIWNCFRSKLIAQIFSDAGLIVIPAPTWAQEKSFSYCFDGLPKRSVLMISTRGVHNSGPETLEIWKRGMTEALKRLKPTMILQYGKDVPGFDYGVPVKQYKLFNFGGNADE